MNINYKKWFVGFTDAEGNFYTNKECDTQTFSIHLSLKDKDNLYLLKKNLNFGEVYEDPKNNRVLFSVTQKELLYTKLIPIFEEFPLLTRKFYQYQAFKEILIKRINKEKNINLIEFHKLAKEDKTIEQLSNLDYFEDWLIGFIEGEGSFFFIKDKDTIRPKFSICQKYDKIILEAIKNKINIKGLVHKEKNDMFRLKCQSKKELQNLIFFIESPFGGD